MKYADHVKQVLTSLIRGMADYPSLFVKKPHTDFSRKRKLSFEDTIRFLLSMEKSSMKAELLKFFHYSSDTATTSAFVQQREKLLPEAMEFLFKEFNHAFPSQNTYQGYRLIACDGSQLDIARNPEDTEYFWKRSEHRVGGNCLHLNTFYDLLDRRCVDVLVQPGRKKKESSAMTDMIDRYTGKEKTIFIADRGYETYNIFGHVQQKEMYYLIRVKDGTQGGMVSGFSFPAMEEFDHMVSVILTRKRTKEVKANPALYKRIRKEMSFDYLDVEKNIYYPITFRVVRFKITEDTTECVITNLPREAFSSEELKKLYGMRWGIETAFRELKYAVGLNYFHAKKVAYILQEIYARVILYNFCELITTAVVIQQKERKYVYQVNYTLSIGICRHYLSCNKDIPPPDVEVLIEKNLLPVRPGRQNPRQVKQRSCISFQYRTA